MEQSEIAPKISAGDRARSSKDPKNHARIIYAEGKIEEMKENLGGMKNKLPLLKEFWRNLQKFARKIAEKAAQKMAGYCEKAREKVLKLISNRSVERHALNILLIILPYFVVSYLIYSEFSWRQSLQEVFSLLCIYAAIPFCFNDYIEFGNRAFAGASEKKSILPSSFSKAYFYRLIIGVTACSAPIFFFNNTLAVAIIEICFVIFVEFICIEYMSGCSLFSSKIPVYLVCDDLNDLELVEKGLRNKYKLLDSIILRDGGEESIEAIFAKLRRKLRNANSFAFFPYPRRIFYFSSALLYSSVPYGAGKRKKNPDSKRKGADSVAVAAAEENYADIAASNVAASNINGSNIAASKIVPGDLIVSNLLDISTRFSVPLFKLKYTEDAVRGDSFNILPYSIADVDAVSVSPQEKAMISDVFKDKSVWIFYDGRRCVLELIRLLSDIANLTIFCTSEGLMREMEAEFGNAFEDAQHIAQIRGRLSRNTHKIKIADKSIFLSTDSKPEILFFNPSLLHLDSSEANLKEAVVKNAIDVSEIANAALKLNVKFVFFLSTMEAFETKNWIGATQRLGELYIQSISNRKSQTKFRIMRLPYSITDPSSLFDKAEEAIKNDSIRAATSFESADFKAEDAAQRVREENLDSLLERENRYYYNTDAIFHPFLKLIAYTLRDTYILPDIYSIFPQSAPRNFNDVAEIACKLRGIRPNEDAGVVRIAADLYKEKSSNDGKASNSDVSSNTGTNRRNNNARSGKSSSNGSGSGSAPKRFSKRMEETSIDPAIVLSRAPTSLKYREALSLDINQIRSMSTRDIISIVFQTLNMNEEKDSQKS